MNGNRPDSEPPQLNPILEVVRVIPFDSQGNMLRIRRGNEAIQAANLLSLLGGKREPEKDTDLEATARRELGEETTLTDPDIVFLSELANIIGNPRTPDGLLIMTYVYAVMIRGSMLDVKLVPEGKPGKEDHDLRPFTAESDEIHTPEAWAFGYGYLLNQLLFGTEEFPTAIGTSVMIEHAAQEFRDTLAAANSARPKS